MNEIAIKGAKENNLKNIDLIIPRGKIVCFVGVSGSGKSTIAFDIIAREGQRQYFESLPSFARRYLQKANRPDVEEIKGISSTIIISQERVSGNPRSTVGTLTEAYTYLRMLYSRVGLPSLDSSYYSFNHPNGFCTKCKGLGRTVEVSINKIVDRNKSLNEGAIIPGDGYVGGRQWCIIKASHYFDMDKLIKNYDEYELDKLLNSPPELLEAYSGEIVDRFTFQGLVYRIKHRNTKVHRGPTENDYKYFDFADCPECGGGRLNSQALLVKINGKNIGEVGNMALTDCLSFVKSINLPQARIIRPRLEMQIRGLIDAGVGYLSLNRSTDTLSGGEAQRVKLARQMGCDLIETIYVLDEPTAGLHPRDVDKVVNNLRRLRDGGNTVLVVEHDATVIKNSDYIVEVGPGGGKKGGEIIAQGTVEEIFKSPRSLTAPYLNKNNILDLPGKRYSKGSIEICNAHRNNLKNITVSIPLGVLVALTGVSGSGKSSFVEEIMVQHGEKVVLIDQSSVGNNKRGCIGTYTGIFDRIRKIFAKLHRVSESLFSFNSHGGCDDCHGLGYVDMEMNFLGDVKIKCEICNGMRYKSKVLRYKFKGKNISEVLQMTASEVRDFFDDSDVSSNANLLIEVGLDYIEIGQGLDTLSGGEAQRLKLASRLQKKGEFYILDEPTSGLHFSDINKLLNLINRLINNGNTVLVIEHNLDVISRADWIIDLGPEGGEKGGEIVAMGTVKDIIRCKGSYTGQYLCKYLHK